MQNAASVEFSHTRSHYQTAKDRTSTEAPNAALDGQDFDLPTPSEKPEVVGEKVWKLLGLSM